MIKVEYSRKILLQVIDNAHTDFLLSPKNCFIYTTQAGDPFLSHPLVLYNIIT